jgi:ABC-2 type transport system permease protein
MGRWHSSQSGIPDGDWHGVGRWITTGETYGWVLNGEWVGHGGQIATSTVIWIALPLALGMVRTLGRDVS